MKFLQDSLISKDIIAFLKKLKQKVFLPNFIFRGPPGTGKTTTAKEIIEKFLDKPIEYIELNSSCDRGISTIRQVVIPFSSQRSNTGPLRLVLFEEAENLTTEAQAALRNAMEASNQNCRFIFTCNQDKLDPAIKSRCVVIDFSIDKEALKEKAGTDLAKDLRYFNRILEKSVGKESLLPNYYSLMLEQDSTKLKQQYLKIVSRTDNSPLPSTTQIRESYSVLLDLSYSKLHKKFVNLFIQFENDLYICSEQFLPIIRLLYSLSCIND
jgi:hypothetical protein